MEVFNTSKEAGPLWSHTREACQSPEEADTLSAAGQRARGAEPAGASLCFGHQADAHMYTHIYYVTALIYKERTYKHHERQLSQMPLNTKAKGIMSKI